MRVVFHKADDLVELVLPVVHFVAENLEVIFAEVSGLAPVDVHHLVHLVDRTLHQFQGHRLHHEEFNVGLLDLAVAGYFFKLDASLILSQLENHLQERNDSDFLFEIGHLLHNVGEPGDVLLLALHGPVELIDLSLAQSLHHVVEPLEVGSNQDVNNVFIQEFADIENSLAKQNRHTHFDTEVLLLLIGHLCTGRISQERQAAFEVVLVVVLSFIVQTVDMGKCCVHFRVDVGALLNQSLN